MRAGSRIMEDTLLTTGRRQRIVFVCLLLLMILFLCLDIFFGSVSLSPTDVFNALFHSAGSPLKTIIFEFRIPKAITALVVGIALSLSGLQMQTLFRNPMAGPDVLGISSGASLGVAFVILGFSARLTAGNLSGLGNWILIAASWAGAGAVMILIMSISYRVREIMTILIIGIMLASGISAIVTIMQYFSAESMLKAYVIWTMGSLGNLTSSQLNVLMCICRSGDPAQPGFCQNAERHLNRGKLCCKHRSEREAFAGNNICIYKYPYRKCDSILRAHRLYRDRRSPYFEDFAEDIRSQDPRPWHNSHRRHHHAYKRHYFPIAGIGECSAG